MADYAIANLQDIAEVHDGRCPFRPVRHHFGIMTFGVNAMTAASEGDRLLNEHAEDDPDSPEELYFVVSGHARFELDGEPHDAPAGTFVCVAPGVTRTAFAHETGTTLLAMGGGARGKPYEPVGWELFAPLMPLFQSGDYAEAADRANALLAENPQYALLYFNTACAESRAGRVDDALAHLRRAVEMSPSTADYAREDEDLEAVRAHPAFAEIIGEA